MSAADDLRREIDELLQELEQQRGGAEPSAPAAAPAAREQRVLESLEQRGIDSSALERARQALRQFAKDFKHLPDADAIEWAEKVIAKTTTL